HGSSPSRVAPFAGAWVETGRGQTRHPRSVSLPSRERGSKQRSRPQYRQHQVSLPSRERGSKHRAGRHAQRAAGVAPFAGAWVETCSISRRIWSNGVAPFAGAWVETPMLMPSISVLRVAPFAGAWVE